MMNEATWGKSSSKEEKNSINSGKVSNNCVLKNLVQSTQNCNTVSRQLFHDVSSQLVDVHKLKIGHCRNLFCFN